MSDRQPWRVRAFYRFVRIESGPTLRDQLDAQAQAHGLRGTILLAPEGINGTISAPDPHLDEFWSELNKVGPFGDLEFKDSWAPAAPFRRMKVKWKREIITLGVPEADPTERVGEYVEPEDWNDLVDDPEVVLVDTRNDYEVSEGSFVGAVNPETETFGEFPQWVAENLDPAIHRKVAMFCTGGIRCEKATALLLARGFERVYHLRGGILRYLERVPATESRFEGTCFVFDDRGALETGLDIQARRFDAPRVGYTLGDDVTD